MPPNRSFVPTLFCRPATVTGAQKEKEKKQNKKSKENKNSKKSLGEQKRTKNQGKPQRKQARKTKKQGLEGQGVFWVLRTTPKSKLYSDKEIFGGRALRLSPSQLGPQHTSNQNLGVSWPKSTLQKSGLENVCQEKASAEMDGLFLNKVPSAFPWKEQEGKIHPKVHGKIQSRIWEFCGQTPHCKNPALNMRVISFWALLP